MASPPTSDRIGFVGASSMMGHGMSKSILKAGFPLTLSVFRRREPVADLLASGAVEAPTFAAVAAASDVVYICVTGAAEVDSVLTSETGVLAGARPGLVVVDTSTSEPTVTARLRAACAAKGVTLVDAPLARTPVEAEQGRLNVMVGAEPAMFERLLPLFKGVWAENVVHVGGPGAGHTGERGGRSCGGAAQSRLPAAVPAFAAAASMQAARIHAHRRSSYPPAAVKLINNMLAMSQCTAAAEAFAVAAKSGVDPKKLVDVITLGGVNSGLFQGMAKTLHGDMTGLKFQLDNGRKDIRYYTHMAESVNVPCSHGDAVLANLAMASALGFGEGFVPGLVSAQEHINKVKIAGTSPAPK